MGLEVIIPSVGESITGGVLSVWHKKDGEAVNAGEVLFTLETEKVSSEITAEKAGTLVHKVAEGAEVKIGDVVATIEEGAPAKPAPAAAPAPVAPAKAEAAPEKKEAPAAPATQAAPPATQEPAKPARAKKSAAEKPASIASSAASFISWGVTPQNPPITRLSRPGSAINERPVLTLSPGALENINVKPFGLWVARN